MMTVGLLQQQLEDLEPVLSTTFKKDSKIKLLMAPLVLRNLDFSLSLNGSKMFKVFVCTEQTILKFIDFNKSFGSSSLKIYSELNTRVSTVV